MKKLWDAVTALSQLKLFAYPFLLYDNANLPCAAALACLYYLFYNFSPSYNHSFMLFSHAIIVYSRYRIPNLHLMTCTYYHVLPFFYMAGCTFFLDLFKRHLKAVFHSVLFSIRILFIRLFFYIFILFICIILILIHFSFLYFSFV